MAEMTKREEQKAYQAGRALLTVQWPDDTPVDTRLGEHHCPFAAGDPQRAAWMRGLRDALNAQIDEKERAELLKRLDREAKA